MSVREIRRMVAPMAVLLLVSACSSGATSTPTAGATTAGATAGPTAAAVPPAGGWPWTGKLPDGTPFTLSPAIADKVKAHQPINFVYAGAAAGTDIYSEQRLAGYTAALPNAQKIYPLNPKYTTPATAFDWTQELAQIEALVNTNQVDCFSIAIPDATQYAASIAKILGAGIPVFSIGVESKSNDLMWYAQYGPKEGEQAAKAVLDWAKTNNIQLTKIALTSGQPEGSWAQDRMNGFKSTILAAMPSVVFVNDVTSAVNTTFDSAKAYDIYKAYLLGHPDVQVMFNSDLTGNALNRAIVDTGNKGKMWSIAWNPSFEQLDAVDAGVMIAVMDQKWAEQAGDGPLACATFFAKGQIMPNDLTEKAVTKANSAESRAELVSLLGSPAPSASN